MSSMNTNGRVRKSLADQIDRLDQVLDGLTVGLHEAVASAVRDAVEVAVRETVNAVLTEVLTNPVVQEKLRDLATPPEQPVSEAPKPGLRERIACIGSWIGEQVRSAYQAACSLLSKGCRACSKLCQRVRKGCVSCWSRMQAVRRYKVQLLSALFVGVAVGAAAYVAGPWLAASVSAVGGFAATLSVHVGIWLRRTFGVPAVTDA